MFVPDNWSSAYLLGSYLGDGYLSRAGQLLIVCDRQYPEIIEEVRGAMIPTSLRRHAGISPHPVHNYDRVACSRQHWFEALPQHGPCRTHERPIVFEPWQERIVEEHPWRFLRGPLHSGGLPDRQPRQDQGPQRASSRVRVSALVLLEPVSRHPRTVLLDARATRLRRTQSNHRNISISHRDSVALLDEHVGRKA